MLPRAGTLAGLFLLLSALVCFLAAGCADRSAGPGPVEFVAYSLREAERRARMGSPRSDELAYLGGMTRLVGGVSDPETGDVILVGQVLEGLPRACLDDFVTALRERLLHAVWPRVSIDPTAETSRSRLQAVRLSEGLIDRPFGHKLLACDVILKRYSLSLLEELPVSPSYRALCERDIAQRAKGRGASIEQARWVLGNGVGEPVKPYRGRQIAGEASLVGRFWFYPLDTYSVAQAGGVFVIRELRIGVSREIFNLMGNAEVGNKAAEDFARLMTEHLREVSRRYPVLLELDILYAMASAAEAIAHLEGRAAFDFFLHDYKVSVAPTPRSFDLLETIGIFEQSDRTSLLVRIAGGIELRTALRHLNAGDIRPLREAVLRSRPRPDALSWPLPLTGWRLPNDDHFAGSRTKPGVGPTHPGPGVQEPGCAVITQSYVLEKALPTDEGDKGGRRRFFGFPPPPPPPPLLLPIGGQPSHTRSMDPLKVGGVEIAIEPEGQPADLKAERKKVLGGRPSDDSLSWPTGGPGKETP